MAKNIKAIKCPNCGSIRNTELRPGYFRCSSCDTEYFLDDDDITININHNHHEDGKPPVVPQPGRRGIALLLAIVVLLPIAIMIGSSLGKKGRRVTQSSPEKKLYRYSGAGQIVYRNTLTGKAILLRLGRESIEDAEHNTDYVNTHAVFIDPVTRAELKDDMLLPHIRRLDNYFPSFTVFDDGNIYMVYPKAKLFTIDRQQNKLIEITATLLKNHPEAGAGIATISVGRSYMEILTNDGNKIFYNPVTDQLFTSYNDLSDNFKKIKRPAYFEFNQGKLMQLMPGGLTAEDKDLTPGRKYFDPEIIFQDPETLIIAVGSTASPDAPVSLQRLDINTGKVIWTLPAKTFTYRSAAKCNEGYAVEYSSGEDLDYISGVLIISPEGKILSDYLIKRGE